MSKLSQYYAHRQAIEEKTDDLPVLNIIEWEQLEERIFREETLPQLLQAIEPIIREVKSPLSININYDPNGALVMSFTRNTIQSASLTTEGNTFQQAIVEEAVDEIPPTDIDAENEPVQPVTSRIKRSKSVGFSVSFADGTVIHEKKAVSTWLLALQKIGLETICNNRRKHDAWHRVDGKDVCIVEREETVRSSDGNSPQTFVNGFYVMTQLSNTQKEKDLMALNDFMPKLGIKVVWDDDTMDTPRTTNDKPVIDVEAAQWNLPIKEQFRNYLSRTKTEGTAKSYTSTLDNAVRQFINQDVDANADSIFSYTTPEDVSLCIGILTSSRAFMEENARKHNAMTAALNQYLLFVQSLQNKRLSE